MDGPSTRVLEEPFSAGFVYGLAPSIQALNTMAAEIARTDIPVLLMGESGTGKDAYARLIHRLSQRNQAEFQKISCATVEPGRLLSQVHEAMRGIGTQAEIGTIYLDGIQELDLACQRVLLSLLPDGEGAAGNEQLSARMISSTTRGLETEVEEGRFCRELYFRINGTCLRLPALRDRKEDIPALMEFFLRKHTTELKGTAIKLDNETMDTLAAYHWPGNIRELENLARKIVALRDVRLSLHDLQATKIANQRPTGTAGSSSLKVASRAAARQTERELILQALQRTRWNRKRAARELQISYKSLLYKIKQFGPIDKDQTG
jgi:two-component system, NtrC family, response regulator AtoC